VKQAGSGIVSPVIGIDEFVERLFRLGIERVSCARRHTETPGQAQEGLAIRSAFEESHFVLTAV